MMWPQIHGAIQNTAVGQESGTNHKSLSLLFLFPSWGGVHFSFLILHGQFHPYQDRAFLFPCTLASFLFTNISFSAKWEQWCFLKHSWLIFDLAHNTAVRDSASRALIKNKFLVLKIIFMQAKCRKKEVKLKEISYTSRYTLNFIHLFMSSYFSE